MTLQPGQQDNWHRHHGETVYFEQGGRVEITTQTGEVLALEIADGYVMWHDQWQHQVTNTGDTVLTALIVEQKQLKAKTKS